MTDPERRFDAADLDRARGRISSDLGPVDGSPPPSRYERGPRLGEGAMAVVYEAFDRELGRRVALKTPKDSALITVEARERFQREAAASARLNHPNIVGVHDVGEHEGRPFLVMELVEGEPLSARMARRRDPLPVLVAMVETVARALHVAHRQGLVHRDLKPGNILVTPAGEPKIADFGLAHWIGSVSAISRDGSPIGTPAYMAPEQVRGRSEEIDPRTDVYALGVILYEITAKRPPFGGGSLTEVYAKIIQDPPPRPRSFDPSVPDDLETILLKAMEKEPADRYASALDLAEDLARWRSGDPVRARPPGLAYRIRKGLRRNRVRVGVVLLVALLLGGWGASQWAQRGSAKRLAASLAKLEEARLAVEQAERLLTRPEVDFPAWRKLIEGARSRTAEVIAATPDLPAAQDLMGRILDLSGDHRGAEAAWGRAIALAPKDRPPRLRLARWLIHRSFLEQIKGDSAPDVDRKRPLATLAEARGHLDASGGAAGADPLERDLLATYLEYASARADQGGAIARRAVVEHAGRDGVEEFHFMLGATAPVAERIGHLDAALRLRPHDPLFRFCRGVELMTAGRYAEAIVDAGAALETDPGFSDARINRAIALMRVDQVDEALADARIVIAAGVADPMIFWVRGIAVMRSGETAGPLADFDRALELDPTMGQAYVNRSEIRLRLGQVEKAYQDADAAVRCLPEDPTPRMARANVRMAQGNRGAAAEDYQKALDLAPADWPFRAAIGEMLLQLKGAPKDF